MNIIQASFQASFDSRVERLSDVDLADLRVIFRYFDTDGDGAVSADQACRMFALLGLDVNTAQVRDLGEVYLNEFMKIVDSHVAKSSVAASEAPEAETVGEGLSASMVDGEGPSAEETERKLRNEKVLEDEWKLLDTYRRGRVSLQELRLFLLSCRSTLSLEDTERFLETFGNTMDEDRSDELEFTKEGFLKFRREYTMNKMIFSDDDLTSDEDDAHGLMTNAEMLGQQAPASSGASERNQAANDANVAAPMRVQSRHAERGPSNNSSDRVFNSTEHEHDLIVNPDEFVESDESEEEAATAHANRPPNGGNGHEAAKS